MKTGKTFNGKLKILVLCVCGMLAVTLAATETAVSACDLPRGSRSLWNVKALDAPPRTFTVTVPCSNNYGRIQGVEPIFIEGEPWKGKPTRVFAWWGLPEGACADRKVPAMVLVHGGGGTAFAKWVKTWNDRGYAAIAMDTCGGIPQGERDGKPHPRHEWSGPSGWGSSVAQIGEPVRDQWTYHAVAAVMRCHSFLRARPEVDASRIGLTGISWGGYLSSIVGSVDDRFRFAAPVYGCGFYELNPAWHTMGGGGEKLRAWYALWDAKNFYDSPAGGARIPYLWCCGTNDRFYPLDTVRKSCNMLGHTVPLNLSLKLNMPHAHPPAGDPKEITAMANAICKDGKPLIDVTHAWLEKGGVLRAAFDAHGRTVARAELLCTCDPNPLLMKRKWQVAEVKDLDKSGRLSVSVPEDAVMFFVNLVDSEGLVASSRIFERADWGLVDHPRNPATDWMVGGCGAFAHYLVGKEMFDRIGEFDVQGLVKQIVDIKPDWFCITLGQNSGYMCSPNETYERICGYAPGSHCSKRDIPAELIAALKPTGIKVMLYLPCQTPNRDVHAVKSFGFPEEKANHDRMINVEAARRWGQVIEEWSRRYGKDVAGWWFDGGYRHIRFNDEIAEIYAAAAKRGNPEAVVAFNEGVRAPIRPWTFAGDYLAGEINEPLKETCAGRWMDDRQWHLLTFAGSFWGRTDCRYEDKQWIDWMTPILKNGGAITIDLAIDRPTGRLNDAQAAQLKRVFKACRPAGTAACAADGSSFTVSDPFIWRDDAAKCYRLYQLSRADDPVGAGVMMRTSTNLVDWSEMTQVLHVPESYECLAVWAPEMHVYKGSYYIFGTICTKMYPTNCVAPMAEAGWQPKGNYLRKRLSTYVFKADRPEGPFKVWSDGPIPPRDWATLDGTFFEEDGKPYMVFCHEWTQLRDGTMDAVEMTPDLTRAAGSPVTLFRASDLWQEDASKFPDRTYVTDGPFLYRSKTGELFMLWSSARKGYLQVASRSASGMLRGPWVDHKVIYANDSGHGMVFRTFEGTLAIALHSPNHPGPQKRLRIYELEDLGHALRVGRQIGGDFSQGVHTPETSKLFERRTDPESGVVSYSLVYGAPDDNRQSLYFVTKSMTEDGRFLVFNYTKGNERKGRGPRKLMVADLLKDEVHELGDPGMIPFVDCKKDYIVYGRLKQNPGFYRQNLDDPGREIKLCDIPGALTEMGRVRYLATHLTLTRDRSKAFLDASVIAPNGATNYVQGLLTLANGAFESWGTTDFFCNHGQLNPVRDDLALCAWEEAWLKPGQDYKKKTGWYPRMWLVEPGGKRTLVPARDRNCASHEVWDDDGKGFSWCGRPGDYVYHHDLATGRQERWCGIAGARHNNVSPDNRYVVCDDAPEAWWRGCKWRVAFWNRETGRGVWIYSTRPALMPREKPSRLHPDPHPHFVMNGRYVVCTANNADGHMDLYVTPVDQLVKMTTP